MGSEDESMRMVQSVCPPSIRQTTWLSRCSCTQVLLAQYYRKSQFGGARPFFKVLVWYVLLSIFVRG
jgi:hypothetical protein